MTAVLILMYKRQCRLRAAVQERNIENVQFFESDIESFQLSAVALKLDHLKRNGTVPLHILIVDKRSQYAFRSLLALPPNAYLEQPVV